QEQLSDSEAKFVAAAIKDLKEAQEKKAAVVAAGETAEPHVHALVHAINEKLGAVGSTMTLLDDPTGQRTSTHFADISKLAGEMAGGQVNTLLMLGGNPVYDAPADLHFRDALAKVPMSIHLSLYFNETSSDPTAGYGAKWHLPRAHYLEAWGDARAWDGTASVTQPLIEPLYGGKTPIEVLAIIAAEPVTSGEQIVRRTWSEVF